MRAFGLPVLEEAFFVSGNDNAHLRIEAQADDWGAMKLCNRFHRFGKLAKGIFLLLFRGSSIPLVCIYRTTCITITIIIAAITSTVTCIMLASPAANPKNFLSVFSLIIITYIITNITTAYVTRKLLPFPLSPLLAPLRKYVKKINRRGIDVGDGQKRIRIVALA